ncbi:hypothetical protein C1645_834175 [Glomus cerebriforme]|uniref:Uncharacterized protein n=1 Tax=Glomus cerebriforme TaxID=658196 RepID=A0A397SKU0_9GLOM|nr:hypothetical protein C1645_834175 [Glomus cerebriforme]
MTFNQFLLNKKPKTITLDRIQYKDSSDETTFTKDPTIIESKAIKHYQMLGDQNSFNQQMFHSLYNLPSHWQPIYQPSLRIQDQWYTNILKEIDSSELNDTLRNCPNNKLAGKSSICYEDIKNAHAFLHALILKFYNNILKFQIYPTAWSFIKKKSSPSSTYNLFNERDPHS